MGAAAFFKQHCSTWAWVVCASSEWQRLRLFPVPTVVLWPPRCAKTYWKRKMSSMLTSHAWPYARCQRHHAKVCAHKWKCAGMLALENGFVCDSVDAVYVQIIVLEDGRHHWYGNRQWVLMVLVTRSIGCAWQLVSITIGAGANGCTCKWKRPRMDVC